MTSFFSGWFSSANSASTQIERHTKKLRETVRNIEGRITQLSLVRTKLEQSAVLSGKATAAAKAKTHAILRRWKTYNASIIALESQRDNIERQILQLNVSAMTKESIHGMRMGNKQLHRLQQDPDKIKEEMTDAHFLMKDADAFIEIASESTSEPVQEWELDELLDNMTSADTTTTFIHKGPASVGIHTESPSEVPPDAGSEPLVPREVHESEQLKQLLGLE